MVSCYEEGFRLTDAASECSMRSKARIDTLFEDTRSICSSIAGGWGAPTIDHYSLDADEMSSEEQVRANGAVQARIEAMFASVEAETGTLGKSAAAVLPVRYMGAAAVGGRVASVRGLQEPLRQLLENVENSTSAELEISRRGLTFRGSELSEKTNPFRRIAVWSALRLRSKASSKDEEVSHAFLPLVTEEQKLAKGGPEEKHADLYRVMKGVRCETKDYPPIFAVVMRRPGAARLLECHAFACKTEEDAVAAAATLYRALLADLEANRRRPRQNNGLGCVSLASVASSFPEPSILGSYTQNSRISLSSSPGIPGHPIRPPRSKKHSTFGSDKVSARSVKPENQKPKAKVEKVLEIKAEDILEGRSRKLPASRMAVLKELRDGKSSGTNKKTQNEPFAGGGSSNEEMKNFTNKLRNQGTDVTRVKEPRDESLNYSYKNVNSGQRFANNYEKLPKISKSFDYQDNPEMNYSFVERNGSGVGELIVSERKSDFFESKEASYELNRSGVQSPSKKRENSRGGSTTPSRSGENSMYEMVRGLEKRPSREKMYEEHFKDADKIYSLEDAAPSRLGSKETRRSSQSEENFSFSKPNKLSNGEAKKHAETRRTTGRLSRIETMDKPLRNNSNGFSRSKENEESLTVRKRTRAGSEPPFGRTEDAVKINRQETKLKRSQSDMEVDRGDPMTRVELPRRGSFLKPGSARLPNNVNGSTPLGFTELFDEFRNQEGLTSVDDILAAIIDPEGMSFNDLKPLYKEFLLKLAATLTQDELYERSASIMRRRRRPQRRRSTRKSCLLGRAIKRSVSRLKGGPTEFTSVIFPARKLNDSFDSSSSCEARNHRKNSTRVLASRLSRKRASWRNKKSVVTQTTSEDSDTCRRLVRSGGAGANRSSSGYVSCSECSYDSESCTCVSADKCYCSLSRRAPAEPEVVTNTLVCACDTDSCSDSNKCYCARKASQPTILEQLRQRGIVPSESSLSRAGSPERGKTARTNRSHASSKSLEFLKVRPSPGRSSSDNLALDYDLFSPGKKSQHSSVGSGKVLVVSARDPQGRLVYVGGTERDKKCFEKGSHRSEAHHEALSIKKSAEIAAIFGPGSVRGCRRASSISSARSSASLEAGLGYLP